MKTGVELTPREDGISSMRYESPVISTKGGGSSLLNCGGPSGTSTWPLNNSVSNKSNKVETVSNFSFTSRRVPSSHTCSPEYDLVNTPSLTTVKLDLRWS